MGNGPVDRAYKSHLDGGPRRKARLESTRLPKSALEVTDAAVLKKKKKRSQSEWKMQGSFKCLSWRISSDKCEGITFA